MIDTIQIKNRLKDGGLGDSEAESIAEEMARLVSPESQLATKADLRAWALRVVLANGAITAALLALYGFAA